MNLTKAQIQEELTAVSKKLAKAEKDINKLKEERADLKVTVTELQEDVVERDVLLAAAGNRINKLTKKLKKKK